MLVALCLLLLAVVLWCKYQWTNRRLIKAASSVPTAFRKVPLIGNLHVALHGFEAFGEALLESAYDYVRKGVRTMSFWVGPIPLIFISDQKHIQKALTSSKSMEKSDEYKFFEFAFGNGLITAPVDIWRIKRRFSSRIFQHSNVDEMMSTFNRNNRQLVNELSKHVGTGPFNILPVITVYAIINMSNFLLGTELEFTSNTKEIRKLEHTIERITDLMIQQIFYVWLRFKPIFDFFHGNDLKEIDTVFDSLIKYSKKVTKDNGVSFENSETSRGAATCTYENIFTAQGKEYPELSNDYNHKSDLVTLYLAGSDTVAVTVSNCLLALAKHTQIQNRLFEEIKSTMGDREDVTVQDLQRMEYLEQVYQETLRWGMTVPAILRKASEDLELGDVTIPAGNSFGLILGALNVDPQVFPDHKIFNPDNFSADRRANRDPKCFLPFSGGPRNCPGKRYAELFVKTKVIHVVRNYVLTTEMDTDNLRKKITVVAVNSEGYFLSVARRESYNV